MEWSPDREVFAMATGEHGWRKEIALPLLMESYATACQARGRCLR
jgi:hypothetical protein